MGEYWDQMPEVEFEVDLKKRRCLFTIEEELADKVREIAKAGHISSEALINFWTALTNSWLQHATGLSREVITVINFWKTLINVERLRAN